MVTTNFLVNFPKTYVNRLDKKEIGSFTQVFNHIIDGKKADELKLPSLRPTANVLLQNILAKTDGWDFSIKDMKVRVRVGEDAIRSARKELVETGYLKIIRFIDKVTGRNLGSKYFVSECAEYREENKDIVAKKVIYHVEKVEAETFSKSDSLPCVEKPHVGSPVVEKPHVEKQYTNNTDSNNTYNKNTNIQKENLSTEAKSEHTILNDDFLKNESEEINTFPEISIFESVFLQNSYDRWKASNFKITDLNVGQKEMLKKMISFSNNTGNLTHKEKVEIKREVENIPPAGPAVKVTEPADNILVDKLKKLGLKGDGLAEVIRTIDHKLLHLYADNFDYFRNKQKIGNEAGFFITAVKNTTKDPEKYPIPAAFLAEEKRELKAAKKKDLSGLGEILGIKGLADVKTIKSFIKDFYNCFKTTDEIAVQISEKVFHRELELTGNPEYADQVAAKEVKSAIEKSSGLRITFEKVLAYLGINDELNKFNYASLINKSINQVEMKLAGAN